MAVFTTFSDEQLRKYLAMYGLGKLKAYQSIPEGAENSNFFVTLKSASDIETDYVLTVFEAHDFNEVPAFTRLIQHLHYCGLPVAAPVANLDGVTTCIFRSKPAVLFQKMPGFHILEPTTNHCRSIGSVLADLHNTEFPGSVSQAYQYDLNWFERSLKQLQKDLNHQDVQLLQNVITDYANALAQHEANLGKSIIHGDLFRDNVLFQNDQVSGLIDFYHAGIGTPVLDLAITVNDWCHDNQQQYLPDLFRALLAGYQSNRPLTELEADLLPVFLRVAAAKFWIRRAELAFAGNQRKDPEEFRIILQQWSDMKTIPGGEHLPC